MTITVGSIRGPAGTFAITDRARLESPRGTRVAPTFLGINDLSVEFWIRPTAFPTVPGQGRILRVGDPTDGPNVSLDIRIRNNVENLANTVFGITKRVLPNTTGQFWHGLNNQAAATLALNTEYHCVFVFPNGANPIFYINGTVYPSGETETGGGTGTQPAGPIAIPNTYELTLGDPGPDSLDGFVGVLGRVFVWPFAMTQARAFASYRAQLLTQAQVAASPPQGPSRILGIASPVAFGSSNRGPVAVPYTHPTDVQATTQSGDINVAGRAFEPNGTPIPTVSPTQPAQTRGTVNVVANQLRYTPQATPTPPRIDEVPYQIQDANIPALISRSIVRVSVVAAPTGGGDGYPPIGRQVTVSNGNQLREALTNGNATLGTLRDGDNIFLNPGNYTGTFDFNTGAGTVARPVAIRTTPANVGQAIFPADVRFNQTGARTFLAGATFRGRQSLHSLTGANAVAFRNLYDNTTIITDNGNGDNASAAAVIVSGGDNISFLFCEFVNQRGWSLRIFPSAFRPNVHRCYWHDTTDSNDDGLNIGGRESLQLGQSRSTTDDEIDSIVTFCYFLRCQQGDVDNEVISIKSRHNLIQQCHLDTSRTFTMRHGSDNAFISCRASGAGTNGFFIRGDDNELGGNIIAVGNVELRCGNRVNTDTGSGTFAPVARRTLVDSNTLQTGVQLRVGDDGGGANNISAQDTTIRNHLGAGTIRVQNALAGFTGEVIDSTLREVRTTYNATASKTYPAVPTLNNTLVGPSAPWNAPPRGYGS